MAETLDVLIDLNDAGLDLEPEELEAFSYQLAEEMKDGLVEDARLAEESEVPERAKGAGFDLGFLKAEVNIENTVKLLNWLRERIAGSTLKIQYGDVALEYRTEQQLEQQIKALERIAPLTVRVVRSEEKSDAG